LLIEVILLSALEVIQQSEVTKSVKVVLWAK